MRIRRRSLRKLLIAVGCLVASIQFSSAIVGGLLLLVGAALHFWSKGILLQNRRLTTAGPYRFTRNPFYFANLLIDLGLCFVIARVWVGAIFLPIWFFSYRETIAREETRLRALFPDEFPEYRKAVPPLIPTGRRLPVECGRGEFRLANEALAKGSEYARIVGIFLAPGMIWAAESIRRVGFRLFDAEYATTLAYIVILPSAWIFKLALAETFRRPETRLLPFASRSPLRVAVAFTLSVVALFLGDWWAMNLPVLWCLLMVLDGLGESRLGRAKELETKVWRYFKGIAYAGALAILCIEGMIAFVAQS